MAMQSVCAVVLSFNRRELLARCIDAVERQTRRCERVLVVDNGSSDGSAQMLAARWPGRVEVHRLPHNLGAAGGFEQAMRRGHATGADAIWLMDDDVLPEPDALERLLAAARLLEAQAIAAPFLVSCAHGPGGEPSNVPDVDERRNALDYPDWPRLLAHGIVPVTRATFVSILLPRTTPERHGLPIADMFIWGEDSEYTRRVTREQPGWLVGGSRALHLRAAPGRLDIRTETDERRIGWHALKLRNELYMARAQGRRHALRALREAAVQVLRLLAAGERRKAGVLARGLLAGLRFAPAIPVLEAAAPQPSRGQAASLAEIVDTGSGQTMPS